MQLIARGTMMALVAAAAPALAQDGRASDRALAPLVACRQIGDVRARAACYDAALDKLQQSVAARTVVVMDREEVKEDRRSSFGFGGSQTVARVVAPKPARTARPGAPVEELEAIDSTVVSASPYGYERWTIRIATGAVWRTTEAGITLAPKPGATIRIRRGLMGSFSLRIGNARPVRALRVN